MDKAKILRLCNEIEMIMCEVYNTGHTMQNCDYEAVDKMLKAIAAEISTQPKSNADRIRQMTDEELAKLFDKAFMSNDAACNYCGNNHPDSFLCEEISCEEGFLKWLQKEADKDAGTD